MPRSQSFRSTTSSQDAVARREGSLGDLVARVVAHEQGDFAAAAAPPLDARTVTNAYIEAIDWATRTVDIADGL